MPTVFSRIMARELPGAFVWEDDRCVAFMARDSLHPGHLLVVPREEVDHWLDADDDLMAHLVGVARTLGRALQRAFPSEKVALLLVGLEVSHLHLHVTPIDGVGDVYFASVTPGVPIEQLQASADAITAELP